VATKKALYPKGICVPGLASLEAAWAEAMSAGHRNASAAVHR